MASIDLTDLRKSFTMQGSSDGLVVFDGLTLSVHDSEFVCMLGKSGCGKSTVMNMISGLDKQFSGSISIDGSAGGDGDGGTRIGYVFQEPRLLPWLSIGDNLRFALRSSGVPRHEWRARAEEWLDRVGLNGFHNSYPHQLSGGMQQRASIARALAIDPDILLMDEPFSGLDEFTGRAMREQLLELWQQSKKTLLFVTHNCFEACYLADRILILGQPPAGVAREIEIDLLRPRDYEDEKLFRLSNDVTHKVMVATGAGEGLVGA